MTGKKNPLSYYIPKDAGEDAPSKPDPRVDDGAPPAAPANVGFTSGNGTNTITFNKNAENDVVGYRLYRSTDGVTFDNTGLTALTGEDAAISDSNSSGSGYYYYVTAVDVAGNESQPSAIVGYNNSVPEFPDFEWNFGDSPDEVTTDHPLPPSAPSAPDQVSIKRNDSGFTIQWAAGASSEQISEYTIYYSESEQGPFNKLGTSSRTQFSFKSDAPNGWIQVTSMNEAGESAPSAPVQFKNKD